MRVFDRLGSVTCPLQPAPGRKGGEPFGMAGIWERAAQPGQSPVDTAELPTTAANELVAERPRKAPRNLRRAKVGRSH